MDAVRQIFPWSAVCLDGNHAAGAFEGPRNEADEDPFELLLAALHLLQAHGAPPLNWSAPSDNSPTGRQRSSTGWLGRALALTDRALHHASDASDQGPKLVMIAHHHDPEAH